jgi:protein-L-isoaspartate O-methyltransferase
MDWSDAARKLADSVTTDAPEWHEAVSSTPRHSLILRWWKRIPDSPAEEWALISPEPQSDGHIAATYRDETLVTRVGPHHADLAEPADRAKGSPTSSSTLPSLVVSMLHHLDAHPGHRVLDVGTGSGYSAALLGLRIGDDYVTSVDVDAYLVEAARSRLAGFGRHPRIEATDATGPLPNAEYDRIVATVSVRPVPASWLKALSTGGRIITTIAHTTLLVAADMHPDGLARGTVLPNPASFMEARRETDYPPRRDSVFAQARDADGDMISRPRIPIPDLWQEWTLRYLYELDTPEIEIRAMTLSDDRRVLWLLAADGSWARAEDGPAPVVHQSGPRRLWDALEAVSGRWEEAGRFPLHALTAELAPGGGMLTAPKGWRLPL